jgi:uncharacterized protein YktA (UPF0223 family)
MEEMVKVTNLYAAAEQAYEEGMKAEEYIAKYKEFKTVVKSIGEEKRLDKEFTKASGYSIYRTTQSAKAKVSGRFKMEG